MKAPYSSFQEVMAERAADAEPIITIPITHRPDPVDEDWAERQKYLDNLDDQDLLRWTKDECLHASWYYGKTLNHKGVSNTWEFGLVCSRCKLLIASCKDDDIIIPEENDLYM